MPALATAHTFCASCDGPRKSGFLTAVPATAEIYFICAIYKYAGNVDLSKGYWIQKRSLG